MLSVLIMPGKIHQTVFEVPSANKTQHMHIIFIIWYQFISYVWICRSCYKIHSKVNRCQSYRYVSTFMFDVVRKMSWGIEKQGFHVVFQGDFFMAVAALLVLPTCLAGAEVGWDGDDNWLPVFVKTCLLGMWGMWGMGEETYQKKMQMFSI